MALMEQGIWSCIVLGAAFGEDDKGLPQVQINVKIDDGPDKGRNCTYEDQVNVKSAKYITWSCKAVGWTGGSLDTLKADCAKWIAATGGKSTVEIRHLEIKRGPKAGQMFAKVNGIGRGPRVLKDASRNALDDANEAMRMAAEYDRGPDEDDGASPF